MAHRPRLVLRSGAVVEYPEDHYEEIADLEVALGVDEDGRPTVPNPWVGVGHASIVRPSEVVAVLWSADITVATP